MTFPVLSEHGTDRAQTILVLAGSQKVIPLCLEKVLKEAAKLANERARVKKAKGAAAVQSKEVKNSSQ